MRPFARILLFAVLLLLPVSFLSAQAAADISGHWEGSIVAPTTDVVVEIDVDRNGKAEFTGTISIPSQNLNGLPLSGFVVEGTSISFQMKGSSAGDRTFKGFLSADGKSASGGYTQMGFSMPFSLTRTGDSRIEPLIKSAPIGKELEGTWSGTLDINGTQRRLVLTMSNQPDGFATGSIVNIDEGLEIPIATITQKASSLILDVKAVGSSYSGALNADGTELVGAITQRQVVLPLTFRRTAN